MSNLGSGGGSSFPGTLDSQSSPEVDSPAGAKTKARAAVPNDIIAAVLAIETNLGTNAQGSKTDVKTFLQTQHNADGTHAAITASTISATGQITSTIATGAAPLVLASTTPIVGLNLPMTGEASASGATTADLNLGTVTSGDRIFFSVAATGQLSSTTPSYILLAGYKSSGTATFVFSNSIAEIDALSMNAVSGTTFVVNPCAVGILEVTGTGTLVMQGTISKDANSTFSKIELYSFFLKKQ